MIIQCPACATRYVVPESAIGVDGRTVRCAKCRHNWFQDGPQLDVPEGNDASVAKQAPAEVAPPPPPPPPAAEPELAEPEAVAPEFAEPEAAEPELAVPQPTPQPTPQPAAEPEPAPAEQAPSTIDDGAEPPLGDEPLPPPVPEVAPDEVEVEGLDHSPFDAEPPFRPRRNWLKVWSWAAPIFAIFAAAIIFAVSYWGLPDWVPVTRPDFAAGEPDLQLDFPIDQQEKREMPNGQEYFAVNGTITNIGGQARDVPAILVVLRDARDRNVFELEIVPEQASLAPGESLDVTRAVLDVPRSARVAEIGWKAQ